jgi:hypothetical protein
MSHFHWTCSFGGLLSYSIESDITIFSCARSWRRGLCYMTLVTLDRVKKAEGDYDVILLLVK